MGHAWQVTTTFIPLQYCHYLKTLILRKLSLFLASQGKLTSFRNAEVKKRAKLCDSIYLYRACRKFTTNQLPALTPSSCANELRCSLWLIGNMRSRFFSNSCMKMLLLLYLICSFKNTANERYRRKVGSRSHPSKETAGGCTLCMSLWEDVMGAVMVGRGGRGEAGGKG